MVIGGRLDRVRVISDLSLGALLLSLGGARCRRRARRRESISEIWSCCVETEKGCGDGMQAEFQVVRISPFFLSSFSGPRGAWIEVVLRCHFEYGTDFGSVRVGEEIDFLKFETNSRKNYIKFGISVHGALTARH